VGVAGDDLHRISGDRRHTLLPPPAPGRICS
jgi:hypothetical protein